MSLALFNPDYDTKIKLHYISFLNNFSEVKYMTVLFYVYEFCKPQFHIKLNINLVTFFLQFLKFLLFFYTCKFFTTYKIYLILKYISKNDYKNQLCVYKSCNLLSNFG